MKVKFTILGSGSSLGIPRIDGYFGKCNPKIKKNNRMRCSAIITSKNKNILFDTSPDLRMQLLDNKIKNIDNVFYTHPHADQTHGINELRVFYLKNKKKLNIFADKKTSNYLLKSFTYCFKNTDHYPATLKLNSLKNIHYIENIKIRAVKVKHGLIDSNCYIINDKCAYAPDVSKIFSKDYKYFWKLKYLVIDCLRYKWHPSHFNLENVLSFIKEVKPKKTILTNMNNEIDYNEIKSIIPKNVAPAYDGMSVNL